MLEWLQGADAAVLLWLQDAVRNTLLTPVLIVYTHLGDRGFLWLILSALLLCCKKTRRAGAVSLLALLLSLLCTNIALKNLVRRARPWVVIEQLIPLAAEHDPHSFPSGHTSAAFASAGAWCRTLPRRWMKILSLVMAAVMGFSRLYVGVHYPSDVLAGACIGLLCGWLAWLVWTRLAEGKRKRWC